MEMSMPKITPPPRFNCVQLSAPTLGHIPPYQEVQTEPPLTPADYGLWRSINTSDQMFQGSTVLGDKYNPPHAREEAKRHDAATC